MITGLGNFDVTSELASRDLSISLVSNPILVIDSIVLSATVIVSGSPVGYLSLQGSNDISKLQIDVPDNSWGEIKYSQKSVALSGAYMWNYANEGYKWLRIIYQSVSGSGKIDSFHLTTKR